MNNKYVFDVEKLAESLPLLDKNAVNVVKLLVDKQLKISTAESCTGGLVSTLITSVSGASSVFEAGFCTYSERIKEKILNVPDETIVRYGVVSEETALAMAVGAKEISSSDIAVSVTGIAGPLGAEEGKPVGTVCVGFCFPDRNETYTLPLYKCAGIDREAVRKLTANAIFIRLNNYLSEGK